MPTGDSKIDEFESVFRSALKEVFDYNLPTISSVVVVTDLSPQESERILELSKRFLDLPYKVKYSSVTREDWGTIPALLQAVERLKPDLIVTYRHLLTQFKDLPYTLGSAVDTLTQAMPTPVMLLPPPVREDFELLLRRTGKVMVVTDQITGDDRLVNWGLKLTREEGTLYLVHIEDRETLTRYLEVIGMIRGIDSEQAAKAIPKKLLELPREFIESIVSAIKEKGVGAEIVPDVMLGHAVTDYRRLVKSHAIDLLIMNTKDPKQNAMHAMAHALSVEIRDRTMLLL